MEVPLVSIIMPAFNVQSFISESIESVIAQSFEKWELIIVDDNSADQTVDRVTKYLGDKRIRLVRNKTNLGGSETRNIGLSIAGGRFIAFLDSDDLWHPNKLEEQISFMLTNKVDFSYTGYQVISERGKRFNSVNCPARINFERLCTNNYIGCLTVIYDAASLGKVPMPCIKKRQDFALWLKLLGKVEFGYGLQLELASYRIRSKSLSRNKLDNIKYYYHILRSIGHLGSLRAGWSTSLYVILTTLKKYAPKLYNLFVIKLR